MAWHNMHMLGHSTRHQGGPKGQGKQGPYHGESNASVLGHDWQNGKPHVLDLRLEPASSHRTRDAEQNKLHYKLFM